MHSEDNCVVFNERRSYEALNFKTPKEVYLAPGPSASTTSGVSKVLAEGQRRTQALRFGGCYRLGVGRVQRLPEALAQRIAVGIIETVARLGVRGTQHQLAVKV